jgi:hypothetical protein
MSLAMKRHPNILLILSEGEVCCKLFYRGLSESLLVKRCLL